MLASAAAAAAAGKGDDDDTCLVARSGDVVGRQTRVAWPTERVVVSWRGWALGYVADGETEEVGEVGEHGDVVGRRVAENGAAATICKPREAAPGMAARRPSWSTSD